MAPFNKYIQTQDENYLGYSKGVEAPKPNLALGKLFEGIGSTLDAGIKGAGELLNLRQDAEVKSKLNEAGVGSNLGFTPEEGAIMGQMKNKLAANSTGVGTASNGPDLAGGDGEGGGGPALLAEDANAQTIPPAIVTRELDNLDKQYQMYQNGQLNPTYYLMKQQQVIQQLKQRYPGSEDYIDSRGHKETTAANVIRGQTYADFQAAAQASRANQDKWITEVKGYEKELGGADPKFNMDFAQQAVNNPNQQWEIRKYVAGIRQREHANNQLKADLELKNAQRTATTHDYEQTAVELATSKVAGAADGSLFGVRQMGLQTIQEAISKLNSTGGQIDPALKAKTSAQLQDVITFTRNQIYNDLFSLNHDDKNNPGKKTSLAAVIGAKRANEIIDETMSPLTQARKFLDGDQPTLAANQLQLLKIAETNQGLKTIAVPYFQMLAGLNTIVGAQTAGQIFDLQNKTTGGTNLNDALKALKQIHDTTTLVKGTAGLNTDREDMKKTSPNASATEKAQFLQDRIKFLQNNLRDPKTPVESALNVAQTLSAEDTHAFIRAFRTSEQTNVWGQVAAPDISAKMKELSGRNPQMWDNYKNWNTETFKVLFQENVDHIKRKLNSETVKDVQYNPETNQVEFTRQPPVTGLGGRPASRFPIGKDDFDKLNQGLRTIGGVFNQDKEMGKIPSMLQEMGFPIKPPETEGAGKKLGFAPEGFKPEALKAIDKILKANLETGKNDSHLTNMSQDLKTGLAAMIQDAPGKIEIYSGHRSVERQHELFTAAVKKYGSVEAARHMVAPPGYSMHNYGNAADIRFESPEVANWVKANAGKYGLTFPLSHEPWHIEPVGARSRP